MLNKLADSSNIPREKMPVKKIPWEFKWGFTSFDI